MKRYFRLIYFMIFLSILSPIWGDEADIYNNALAFYRDNKFDEATALLESATFSDNRSEVTMLKGLISYGKGTQALETGDGAAALESLKRSSALFKISSKDFGKSARHNQELTEKIIKQLEDQEEQSQQNEGDQGEGGESEAQKIADKQQQLADQGDKGSESHKQAQEDLQNQTEDLANKSGGQSKESFEQAARDQKDALDKLDKGDSEGAKEAQERAAQALKEGAQSQEAESSEDGEPKGGDLQESVDDRAQNIIDGEREKSDSGWGISNVERNW